MSRQMLIGQDQASAVETAAIVYEVIIDGGEHVYVEIGEVLGDEAAAALVGFVKIDALTLGDLIAAGALALLALLVA